MKKFESRSLEKDNFLALLTHGKRVAGEQMIICVGVTEKGYKKVLGFTQATTEHHDPIIIIRSKSCYATCSIEDSSSKRVFFASLMAAGDSVRP